MSSPPRFAMPTSVAHILGGYAALEAGSPPRQRRGILFLFFVVIVSNLPDLDFLPGFLLDNEGLFHRRASHSIVAAMAVAGGLGVALRGRFGDFRAIAGWTLLAYGSHVLLDMVVPDPSGNGGGVALLWPFLSTEIAAPIPGLALLDPIRWFEGHDLQGGLLRAFVSLQGVRIFLVDAALVLPVVPLAWGIRSLRDRRRRRVVLAASELPLRTGPASPVRVRRERVGVAGRGGLMASLISSRPAGRSGTSTRSDLGRSRT